MLDIHLIGTGLFLVWLLLTADASIHRCGKMVQSDYQCVIIHMLAVLAVSKRVYVWLYSYGYATRSVFI